MDNCQIRRIHPEEEEKSYSPPRGLPSTDVHYQKMNLIQQAYDIPPNIQGIISTYMTPPSDVNPILLKSNLNR